MAIYQKTRPRNNREIKRVMAVIQVRERPDHSRGVKCLTNFLPSKDVIWKQKRRSSQSTAITEQLSMSMTRPPATSPRAWLIRFPPWVKKYCRSQEDETRPVLLEGAGHVTAHVRVGFSWTEIPRQLQMKTAETVRDSRRPHAQKISQIECPGTTSCKHSEQPLAIS